MTIFQEYHKQLVCRADLMAWFAARGLDEASLARHQIGFDNAAITIPIFDAGGNFLFFKYRKSPFDKSDGPKYWYDKGGGVSLFNSEQIAANPDIIICEGEFDCMVLETQGIPAVTSTGGAMSFKEEWAAQFAGKRVFVFFDNDEAGKKGARRAALLIPGAMVMPTPRGMLEHEDVTDFFVKLGRSRDEFLSLCKFAYVPKRLEEPKPEPRKRPALGDDDVAAAKSVPIANLIAGEPNRSGFIRCPFHSEKSASLKIYADNHAHCYGCDWHGDAIDFVMKSREMTFKEAVQFLLGL